jgi:uncharacterized protein (DUF433 family)
MSDRYRAAGRPEMSVPTIVERGRGPQLSTCRITVQDVVPYLQKKFTHDQIREIMPVLSDEEINVVELYVTEHFDEVMEQDRRIRERNANRKPSPEAEASLRRGGEKIEALRKQFREEYDHRQERNGDLTSR